MSVILRGIYLVLVLVFCLCLAFGIEATTYQALKAYFAWNNWMSSLHM